MMKIALVHELLTMRGGAERVLRVLAEIFPEAPIYTLLYDERKLGDWFPPHRVRTSFLQRYAWLSTNHHWYLPWFTRAVEAWDFSEFDLVLSTSSAFAHGIITNSAPKHLCYVNSPARYLWDRTHDVLERAGQGLFGPLRRTVLSLLSHSLRIWDSEAADRPDKLLASSKEVQRRIDLYWRRESVVVYPPLDDFWLQLKNQELRITNHDYFLVVSTLVPYKRIELAISACNALKLPLKIAGEGPDERRLRSLAGPSITFLGYVPTEDLPKLYTGAIATIFPGEEDFGLVPLESMACGTPVIAYAAGGALETMREGETGTFFSQETPEALAEILHRFDRKQFNPEFCRAHAQRFSRERFEREIQENVRELLEEVYSQL